MQAPPLGTKFRGGGFDIPPALRTRADNHHGEWGLVFHAGDGEVVVDVMDGEVESDKLLELGTEGAPADAVPWTRAGRPLYVLAPERRDHIPAVVE